MAAFVRITPLHLQWRTLIYKSQLGPSVEAEFYANAAAEILLPVRTIFRSDQHLCMLIDYLYTPLLQELKVSEEDVVRIGRVVMEKIAGITGKLPVYLDISNEEGWTTLTSTTLDNLGRLVDQRQLHLVTTDMIHQLEH
jgi:hypothetical protein